MDDATADATAEFFDGLGRVGHIPHLDRYTGGVRFDLTDNQRQERWLVSVQRGDVRVSHDEGPANCVVASERAVFDKLARGEARPLAAFLRNQVTIRGSFRWYLVLERLLPGPVGGHDPRDLVAEGRRRR